MKRAGVLVVAAMLFAFAGGCDEDKRYSTSPEPQKPAATAPQVTPTPVQTITIKDDAIPTEADFEDEAQRDITPANMEEELAKIERDLARELTPTQGGVPGPAAP